MSPSVIPQHVREVAAGAQTIRDRGRNELAWISCPALIVIEADLFRRRTVHEWSLAKINWRSEFPYSKRRAQSCRSRGIGCRRHIESVVGWISHPSYATDKHGRDRQANDEKCLLDPHVSSCPLRVIFVPWVA